MFAIRKALKILSKTLSTAFVAAVVLLAVLLAGVRLVGLTPYTVLSGSMEPTYHVGSVIYAKSVDPTTLKEGDPLTYRMGGDAIVTHRIVEVLEEGGFVERRSSQEDKRVMELYPTEKTLELQPELRKVLGGWSRYLTQDFTEEEIELLAKMLSSMRERAAQWMEEN